MSNIQITPVKATLYHVQTRNWNSNKTAHKYFMDLVAKYGVERFESACGDLDDKYRFESTTKEIVDTMEKIFTELQVFSGGSIYKGQEEILI